MNLVKAIASDDQPNHSEIEAAKWDDVVERKIQNESMSEDVKLKSEHKVKIEKSIQEK